MLGCDVDANPVINATGWLKNEKQLPAVGNPVLVLHDVDIKDVGWYQCTTTYYGETISSIGYFLNIHPVENEFLDEEHDSNEEQTGIVIFFWSLTFTSFLLCSKFLSAQILFYNSDFNLEYKSVFSNPIQVLEL